MSRVVVFLGPTLAHDDARAVLDAELRPPAAHGDVLRAALTRPAAIGLVDGVFDRTPSVWHKEILFALSEGVHVYGAASLGALRAAELDVFGMRGVGEVYRLFAGGELEDDDEVAVAHADAEHGFRPTSDAMVDVRATLAAAAAAGVVDADDAARLAARVKEAYYPERLLRAVLDPAEEAHRALGRWLPANRVQRKRDDALALLRRLRDDLADGLDPPRPDWTLQRTAAWESARRRVELAAAAVPDAPDAATADAGLEAVLRAQPEAGEELADRALLIALARDAAAAAGIPELAAGAAGPLLAWARRAHGTAVARELPGAVRGHRSAAMAARRPTT